MMDHLCQAGFLCLQVMWKSVAAEQRVGLLNHVER